jgi:GT2 family glycosyltransferase
MLLSVIIPTFQRPTALAACLECVGHQSLPREDYEVIVTDDSENHMTRDLVQEKFPWAIWTEGPRRGPAANRNHGASIAKGEWVVFVDDDCQPAVGWLDAIASQSADVNVIEGKTVCPGAIDSPFQERVENLRGGVFWSCNLAVRRIVFGRLGGFDEDFKEAAGEDMEFAWRIARDNLHTRFLPGAIVVHPPRTIKWEQIWRRTWMIRWLALYLIKTDQSAPIGASWFTIIRVVFNRETANLIRTSLHYFMKFDSAYWRSKLFYQWWKWVTFPIVLPYLIAWEILFRRTIRASRLPKRA